ncbi:hypothetical protein ACFL6G_10005 [candidate division KSB1 bacterium]
MRAQVEDFNRNFFESDSSRMIQRLVRTGNYRAFRDILMKHNRNNIPDDKIEALWIVCCNKMKLPATIHRYI